MVNKIIEFDTNYYRINIELGYKCNLNCPYCYLSKVINKEEKEDTIQKIEDIFNFLKILNDNIKNRFELLLTGGEPILYYREYIKLLDNIIKDNLDNLKVINLITNGIIFNEQLAKKLREIEEKEKVIIVTMSLHVLNETWIRNYRKYVEIFSPYNVRILKVVNKNNLEESFKMMEFLINLIRETAKEYFKNYSGEFEYFDNQLKDKLLLFINLQKDVNEFNFNFHRKYEEYLRNLIIKYSSEEYLKQIRHQLKEEIGKYGRYGYCGILDRVKEYIKIYPDLKIGGCGFMDPNEWNSRYFKQYTIYDVIENPDILKDSYYTNYGKNLAKKYAKISYLLLKNLGYKTKSFVYCLKRAMIYNNGKLGPYPIEFVKSYAFLSQD